MLITFTVKNETHKRIHSRFFLGRMELTFKLFPICSCRIHAPLHLLAASAWLAGCGLNFGLTFDRSPAKRPSWCLYFQYSYSPYASGSNYLKTLSYLILSQVYWSGHFFNSLIEHLLPDQQELSNPLIFPYLD